MPILDQYGCPIQPATKSHRPIRARYDSAGSGVDNERHWAASDSLSSVSANSASVRAKLRERSRYECANNSYAKGILDTLAAYTVGSGPTLQLTYRGPAPETPEHREAAQVVEHHWSGWAYRRKLAQKLSTMQQALDRDGEAFAMLTDSRTDYSSPVGLDLRLYECDQFDDYSGVSTLTDDAGVRIGSDGNATEYAFLRDHPGDTAGLTSYSSDWISADNVIHLFRRDRPGQLRGVPKTTPALPLFAQLRRFTLATIVAAETAADFAAILTGQATDNATAGEPFERIDLERGAMVTVPDGMTLSQLRAEHPNATFDEFVKAILREIARCLGVPAVLALGDASSYNYSSGRLDLQAFNRQMECERSNLLELDCLDRLLTAWIAEALLIPDFLPSAFADNFRFYEWSWRWPSAGHIDRKKEADGQAAELTNNTTTLAREYAKQGLDWETELLQRSRELMRMRELGLTMATSTPEQPSPSGESEDEQTDEAVENQ